MVRLQVLIFSQFKIMLNVLEDYLRLAGYPFERIDGDVKSRDRQNAIDRFSKGAPLDCNQNLNAKSLSRAFQRSSLASLTHSLRARLLSLIAVA